MAEYAIGIVFDAVSNGRIQMHDIGHVPPQIYDAVLKLGQPATPAEPEKPTPPVPIRKTVTPGHIISLEDGRPYMTIAAIAGVIASRSRCPDGLVKVRAGVGFTTVCGARR